MAVQSRARGSSGHQGLGAPVASTNPPSAHGRLIAALFDIHSQRPRSDGAKHGQIDSDPDLFRVESFAELSRILARVGCNEKARQGGIEWPRQSGGGGGIGASGSCFCAPDPSGSRLRLCRATRRHVRHQRALRAHFGHPRAWPSSRQERRGASVGTVQSCFCPLVLIAVRVL